MVEAGISLEDIRAELASRHVIDHKVKQEKMVVMLQNLHTHSRFCDGADELEDIVLEAINQGFDTIGFSSHSFTPFDGEATA